jgi:alginate O-acetyltransferase complex protein AlgI
VIWGAYHGLFLVVERLGLLKLYKRIGHWPALPLAFLIVVLGWVLFRVESLHQASIIYSKLFYWESGWSPERAAGFEFKFGVAAVFALLPAIKPIRSSLLKWFNASQSFWQILFKTLLGIVLLTICLSELANHGYNPFIYYRF